MRRQSGALAGVCLFYAGTLFGFSFVATPAKFFTPDVAMSDLLLVGRTTFGVFGWVEAGLIALATAIALVHREGRGLTVFIAIILAAQYLGLRPVLDARVEAIVDGNPPEPSTLHHVYGVLELIKLGMLLWIGRAPHFRGGIPAA